MYDKGIFKANEQEKKTASRIDTAYSGFHHFRIVGYCYLGTLSAYHSNPGSVGKNLVQAVPLGTHPVKLCR